MPPALRIASESEVEILLPLMRQYYAFDGHPFEIEKARAALVTLLRDPSLGRAWLVFDGENPVGYVVLVLGYSMEFGGRDAFIDELYLCGAYRGRGWGRGILEFVEEAARALGVTAIHLEVARHNRTAQAVYRRLGFQDRKHYLMTKSIAPATENP